MNWVKSVIFAIAFISTCANAQNIGVPIATTMTVTFPDSSTTFDPPFEVKMNLEQANDAVIIYVSGRTSTSTPSPRDEALAFKRAASARAYLINQGVSPLKIMVNYASASDYAVDNSTPWGRQANQRVEIEMVFIDMNMVAN